MLKNLLHLYNDGHNPFPNMGKGGLGYHLPQYRKMVNGDGFNLDTLQFDPDEEMTQEEADRRNKNIKSDIEQYRTEYPDNSDSKSEEDFTFDELITDPDERLERTPNEFYDDRLRSVLNGHNLKDNKYNKGLTTLVDTLNLKPKKRDPSKPAPDKEDYINVLIKSKDKRPLLLELIKNDNSFKKSLEYHNKRTEEIGEYNILDQTINHYKKIYPNMDDDDVKEKAENLINRFKKKAIKDKRNDYIRLVQLDLDGVQNPFDFEYPNIDIKKITDKTSEKDVDKILVQIQDYKFISKYGYPNKENKIRLQLIQEIEDKLMRRLDHLNYENIYNYMKTVIPSEKFVYSQAINYFKNKDNVGSGIAFENMMLSNDFIPIFKNMMNTEKDIIQTSKLETIPDKDITFMNGTKAKLADACMVDCLSDEAAIDIKDYRKNKGNFFDIQVDKLFGSIGYSPVYKEDKDGNIKLINIQLDNYNYKNIVEDKERSYYFFIIFEDGIYKYNLLGDKNLNFSEKNGQLYPEKRLQKNIKTNEYINKNLVDLGYLKLNPNGEPSYYLDAHDKQCLRIPKDKAYCIVKFI